MRTGLRFSLLALASLLLVSSAGCGSDSDPIESAPDAGAPDAVVEDLDMKPEDFTCITDWDRIRMFRITNLLGHKEEALRIANANEGGDYPVGTVIQLVWFEAMVKRRAGFNPDSQDWEFVAFDFRGGKKDVVQRGGGAEVKNQLNGKSCLECHSGAEQKWDLICEKTHGCEPLGALVTDDLIDQFQKSDPSCPPPVAP